MAKKKGNKNTTQTKKKVEEVKAAAAETQAETTTGETTTAETTVKRTTVMDVLKGFFLPTTWKGKAKEHYVQYLPIILLLGYYPLVMRTSTFNSGLSRFDWFADSNETMVDIFLLPKSRVLYVLGIMMLVFMLYWVWTQRERFKTVDKKFILVGVMTLMVIISAIATPYKDILVNGSFENFETVFVTLVYSLTMIYAYLLFSWSDDIVRDFTWVYRLASPGYIALIAIGFFQAIGKDPFQTDIGKTFFATQEYWNNLDLITITDGEYMTLHNIDYVPIYLGMWLPLLFVLFTIAEMNGERIIRGALFLFTLFDFLKVDAQGGKMGFLAGIVVAVFLIVHRNKKVLFTCIGLGVAGIVLLFAVPKTRDYIMSGIGANTVVGESRISAMATTDEGVDFTLDGEEYHISYKYEDSGELDVSFTDGDGEEVNGKFHPSDGTYYQYYEYPGIAGEGLIVTQSPDAKENRAVLIGTGDSQLAFIISNEVDDTGEYWYQNFVGKYVKMPTEFTVANIFPPGLFSMRGQIWNKTIPLLKNYMFIGAGSGLFITAYPQWDYLEKAFVSSNYDVKPHDVYFQWWIEEGFIYFACLMAFIVIYLVLAIRFLWKIDLKDAFHRLALAVLISVTTFLVSGLFNDSMIVYAPLFWTILGLGCAMNSFFEREKA